MKSSSLPVTVLTGFLGSGKTTLVNRLLKEKPGTRFGLVVNEFGEAALESQLLEIRKQPLFELPSGCLCCVSDGDLKAALEAVVKKDAGYIFQPDLTTGNEPVQKLLYSGRLTDFYR